MEDALKKALEFAKYRQTYSIQQKTLKEKIDAQLTYGYNSGIFKIDRPLLTFVQMLLDQGRTSGIPLIDANGNPTMIDDLEKFRDEIFDRYFSATIEYHESYQSLKKKRSVEKLIDYE
jgi:hypothetical protein